MKIISYAPNSGRSGLVEAVKMLGQKIIDDADEMTPDPNWTNSIEIIASLCADGIGSIEWCITRIGALADKEKEDDRQSNH